MAISRPAAPVVPEAPDMALPNSVPNNPPIPEGLMLPAPACAADAFAAPAAWEFPACEDMPRPNIDMMDEPMSWAPDTPVPSVARNSEITPLPFDDNSSLP